jgi:hypothetical protein
MFGKTLLLSTIRMFFLGQKNLFRGLWIENQEREWKTSQVIYLDMSKISTRGPAEFRQSLSTLLSKMIKAANVRLRGRTPAEILRHFIADLRRTSREKVVLLIDEYDAPLAHNSSSPERLGYIQEELSRIYSVAEKDGEHLRFVLFTGVERFNKDLLFHSLPGLRDITLEPRYSSICGLTVEEFDRHFQPYMESVLAFLRDENLMVSDMSLSDLRGDILDWYGGYSWDGRTRLISPFYLLHFFRAKEFNNFWHAAKTPTGLINLLRKHGLAFRLFDKGLSITTETSTLEPDNPLPVPALFQTGYLSVSSVTRQTDRVKYNLAIPNFACRWILFVYLMARHFHRKPGQLWTEVDQLLRSLRNRNARVTALAFKRLLGSFQHHMEPPYSGHFRQIFLYVMSILGQPLWFDGPEGQGIVNGLFKAPDNVYFVMQMAFIQPVDALTDQDPMDDHYLYDEWDYCQADIDTMEDELETETEAALKRLDGFNYVGALKGQDQKVVKVALVVHSNSVVKVVFQDA